MSTISGVCAKCGKESDKLYELPIPALGLAKQAPLCPGCNMLFGQMFLKWLVGTADTKDAERKARREK